MKHIVLLALFATIQSLSCQLFAEEKLIPVTSFGHLPLIDAPSVSPDGKMVAAILNSEDGPSVVVSNFGQRDISVILRLKKSQDRIDWIEWANDDRLLISSSFSETFQGDRIRVSRLFSINKDGSNLQEIKRKLARKQAEWTNLYSTNRVLSYLPEEPEHIILELYDDLDKGKSVFKVNITTNEFEKLIVNKYDVDSWYANEKGQIVFGIGNEKGTYSIWYRKDENSDMTKLHEWKAYEDETFSPILVQGDKAIVFSDHELHRQAIWQYDIPSGKFENLIYSVENYDVNNAILNATKDKVIGVRYFEHFRKDHYFDDKDAEKANIVKNSFAGLQTTIVSRDKSKSKVIVAVTSDKTPIKYFWFDLVARKAGIWFSEYPHLEKAPLVPVFPYEFEASDGMKLNGYLTMPNVVANKKPKLIVFPHGGPQSRDYQYFSPYVQFFASRGYAVLQVNFRGSSGFNNQYETSGYQEWGQRMQQDVYDAVDWLSKNNSVDTNQTCIVGASYGGYVALTAAIQQPKKFKCVVSIAGIADLEEMANREYNYPSKRPFIVETIGDPTDDEIVKKLEKVSALHQVDNILIPILLIHGEHDTRVHVSQSRDFYKAAKRKKKNVTFVELEKGTHFLDEWENRQIAFSKMDSFLQTHL